MGGLTLLKVPSLVSLLWVLTTSWSCSPQGSDSAQDSDVPLAVPKGETLEGLDWKGDGAEGTHWTAGIFEWDMWAYGGSVENVSPCMTDLNWFLILFSHSVRQLPCED